MSDTAAETVTSAPSLDAASASPASSGQTSSQADTSTSTSAATPVAQPGSETPTSAAPSTTDTRSATSPSNPGSELTAVPAAATPPVDWEKRYKDTQAALTRTSQQAKQYTEQLQKYQGLDPDKARHALSLAEQQAAAQKLKPWHPRHPDYAQTDSRLSKARNYLTAVEAARGSMDEQAFGQYARNLAAKQGVRSEDIQLVNEYDGHVAAQRDQFARDPDSYIQDAVDKRVSAALQQYEQYQSSRTYADRFMSDPANKPLIDNYGPDMLRAMDGGHEVAVDYARLKAENAALRARTVQNAEPVHAAQAQTQALRDQATVRRDTRTSTTPVTPGTGYEAAMAKARAEGLKGEALMTYMLAHKSALLS